MNCILKDTDSKQHWDTIKIKFGVNIPHDHKEAMMFYANNGSTNRKGNHILELKHIYNLDLFNYLGPVPIARIPSIHAKIQVRIIYEYTQYGRYKAFMVSSGNITGPKVPKVLESL